jgi:hypothetical protein
VDSDMLVNDGLVDGWHVKAVIIVGTLVKTVI